MDKTMKRLLMTAVLLSTLSGCYDGVDQNGDKFKGAYVIHNSIPIYPDRKKGWLHLFNMNEKLPPLVGLGREGMTTPEFSVPNWVYRVWQMSHIIIALDVADHEYGISPQEHRANMERIVSEAKAKGFRNVICITSPPFNYDETGICDTLIEVPLNLDDSPDGVHLGENGQLVFALTLAAKLGEVFSGEAQ